jgi:hypothetical protein
MSVWTLWFSLLGVVSLMYELKKNLERYLRADLLGPGPRLMKKEFTRPRSQNVEKHWSKAWLCSQSLAGIVGSNPAREHGCFSFVSVVCFHRSPRRADHSPRGELLNVFCLSVISKPQH